MNLTWGVYGLILLQLTAAYGFFKPAGRFLSETELAGWNRKRLLSMIKGKQKSRMDKLPHWMRNALFRLRRERTEEEIYEGISYLRNVVAVGESEIMSADFVIEDLVSRGGILQPAYIRLLQLLRMNEKSEAMNCFVEDAGIDAAMDYSRLLVHWDEMDTSSLMETLVSYQKNIREGKITRQKKWDEVMSDLLYLPVVVNVMLVLVNFIYIAYFIDQREMLMMFM